jgi:hypothetical protein
VFCRSSSGSRSIFKNRLEAVADYSFRLATHYRTFPGIIFDCLQPATNTALLAARRGSVKARTRQSVQSERWIFIGACVEVLLEVRNGVIGLARFTHPVPACTALAGILDSKPIQQKICTARTSKFLIHRSARVMIVRPAQCYDAGDWLAVLASYPYRDPTWKAFRKLPPPLLRV